MSGKGIAALVTLVAVVLALTFASNNQEHQVSFTLCSASIDDHEDGSWVMRLDTSAGPLLVTDPSLIRVLGGKSPKIGQKFDGQYVGSETHQLKQVSPAENLDKVPVCR